MTKNIKTSTPTDQIYSKEIRRKRLVWFAVVIALIAMAYIAYKFFSNPNIRTTDDAYVNGHVVLVTPEVSGTVTRVFVENTDHVTAGELLVTLDQADAQIELATSEAQLAQAVRNVKGLFAIDARYDADVRQKQVELNKAEADFRARKEISKTGAITGEDLRHANDAVQAARAALDAAVQARLQALVQTNGTTVMSNPVVQIAIEKVRAAALALQRTSIIAPTSGMVAQRVVQLGRQVAPGDPLLAIVPLDHLWVDANFKETQLDGICPGQPATITTDIYGKSVVYHGRVEGVEAGSGAAFALLPPQNATGNWIKVVQRVPVRISLDPAELSRHPLRIGMSAEVEVNARSCNLRAAKLHSQLDGDGMLYKSELQAADTMVAKIIDDNIGEKQP